MAKKYVTNFDAFEKFPENIWVRDSEAHEKIDSMSTIIEKDFLPMIHDNINTKVNFSKIPVPTIPDGYSSQCICVDAGYIYRLYHRDDYGATHIEKIARSNYSVVADKTISAEGNYFHGNSMSYTNGKIIIYEGNSLLVINPTTLAVERTEYISPWTDCGDFYINGDTKLMVQILDDGFAELIREYTNGKWVARIVFPRETGEWYLQDICTSENFIYKVVTYGFEKESFNKASYIRQETWYGKLSRNIIPIIEGIDNYGALELQGIDKYGSEKVFYISDWNGNIYESENIEFLNRYYKGTGFYSSYRNFSAPLNLFQRYGDVVLETLADGLIESKYQCTRIIDFIQISNHIDVIFGSHSALKHGTYNGETTNFTLQGLGYDGTNVIESTFVYHLDLSARTITLTGTFGIVKNRNTGAFVEQWNSVDEYVPLASKYGRVYIQSITALAGMSYATGVLDFEV